MGLERWLNSEDCILIALVEDPSSVLKKNFFKLEFTQVN